MRLKLRELRKARGWTIDQLADRSGLSRGFLSQLENGRRQPGAETLSTLADSLQVPITALIDATDESPAIAVIIAHLSELPPESLEAIAQIVRTMRPSQGK